ncbi:MAG: CheR family methyltransferase [Chitinophagaceae bacterium]
MFSHSSADNNGAGPKSADNADFFVVGIGASAGGIQALRIFFENVPANSGAAYVVILHLSPDHDSKLAELLQVSAKMPVQKVVEPVKIVADAIYVISPNHHLTVEGDEIHVSPNLLVQDRRAPVDIFFRTLATAYGVRAICVILSGTGANGSMGLKHIKEKGGGAFVQSPREAEFNEMPRNAIATGLVDEVLPVSQLPEKIISYKQRINIHVPPAVPDNLEQEQQAALREIFTHLRIRTGHDFSNYKRPTLLRRIERRINIKNLSDLPAYADYLREHAEECTSLLKDILISVTNFFRDPKAFEVLEKEVLPRLIENRMPGQQIRIWVAGCATGEEAYSIAILCAEKLIGMTDPPKIQLFGTDIDEAAIAVAREGLYTINDAADVSAERLRLFFNKEGDVYRVRREIREMILFAHHNFIKDPPFSHLDLLSCRNVLIYINHTAQERVLETFHFALNPGAFLFLGSSESVEGSSDLFAHFNKEMHIFQARQVVTRAYTVPDSVPVPTVFSARTIVASRESEQKALERITYGDLHQRLLEEYAPPSVVVNEDYDIVHISQTAGRYLQVAGGELSKNLLKLIRPEIRLELRSALYQSVQNKTTVHVKSLKVNLTNSKPEIINLVLKPVLRENDIAKGFILVIFEPVHGDINKEFQIAADQPVAMQLEEELIQMKTQLRTAVEEHEFQAEELKASNEELQAMNEELRSSAEELETSKEELQSINEELRTVNQELKVKIEETTIAGNNLQNLINSVGIGTIFLDRSFRVMLFTPQACSIFNLIPSDYGRPLSDITSHLEPSNLLQDMETVLANLSTVEREVNCSDQRTFMMRMLPYRTSEDYINGIVITFVDITGRKASEENIRKSEKRFRILNDAIPQLIWTNDKEGKSNYFNQRWIDYTGLATADSLQIGWQGIVHPDEAGLVIPLWEEKLRQGHALEMEMRLKRADGIYRWHIIRNVPMPYDTHDGIDSWFGTATDIDDLKNAEQDLRQSSERLRVTLESATDFAIITVNTSGLIENWNRGASNIFGYSEQEILGSPAHIIFTDEDIKNEAPEKEMTLAALNGRAADERWHKRKDGVLLFVSGVMSPMYNGNELRGFVKVAREITMQKEAEQALRALEERYRIALRSAEMGAWDWNIADGFIAWNEQSFVLLGIEPRPGPVSLDYFFTFLHPDDVEAVGRELQEAVTGMGVFHAEFRVIRELQKDTRWMSGYGRAITPENGKISRMVGVMYDITERKKLEKEKEDFINIASHELKTPLTSIMAYAEIIQSMLQGVNDDITLQYMEKLNNQVERLNYLINDLLDNTRIAEGHLSLHIQPFDLNILIEECVQDMQHLTTQHKFVIKKGGLPAVNADRERITQVLINLLNNAVKYSPGGGTVTVESKYDKTGVNVAVTDEGVGIPEDMHEKVFDRFFRVANPGANQAAGMGLGLYITAGIIKRHGGAMNVISQPGAGSRFSFTIPETNK